MLLELPCLLVKAIHLKTFFIILYKSFHRMATLESGHSQVAATAI